MDKHDAGEDNAEDLIEDLREPPSLNRRSRPKGEFFPWHKPRKQYIRTHQWSRALENLLMSENMRLNGRPVSYLGLPGDDMLDLRGFHQVCKKMGFKLRYLGLNDIEGNDPDERRSRSIEADLSHSELRSQDYDHIDRITSDIIIDSLQSLAKRGSLGGQKARDCAPYDIINIDLCKSIATSRDSGPVVAVIDAIRFLLEVQRGSRAEPWLLCLTTRTGKQQVDTTVWNILRQEIQKNAQASTEFQDEFLECIGARNGLSGFMEGNDHGDFGRGFVIGFCKWLIRYATTGTPSWEATLIDSAAYSIHDGLDMYSLVFSMERSVSPGIDNAGWSNADFGELFAPRATQHDEIALAREAVARVRSTQNVDQVLQADDKLAKEAVAEAEEMMRSARYDIAKYREWISQGCPSKKTPRKKTPRKKTSRPSRGRGRGRGRRR